jgi:hypothetical protein
VSSSPPPNGLLMNTENVLALSAGSQCITLRWMWSDHLSLYLEQHTQKNKTRRREFTVNH